MKKKILLSLLAVAAIAVGVVGMAAFEAHVINVTAKIENALSVDTASIDFGTVFPQEELDESFDIALSDSFMAEDRVDSVDYIIRQKPKCGWTEDDGTILLGLPTMSGEIDDTGAITCPDHGDPSPPPDAVWGALPSLCEYISKHEQTEDGQETDNDGSLDAFHQTGAIENNVWVWNDVFGRLAKIAGDSSDTWELDLKVPCFGGNCAQDWADFVTEINSSANPDDYTQPIENEHKIYGCDLWVEVTGVDRLQS